MSIGRLPRELSGPQGQQPRYPHGQRAFQGSPWGRFQRCQAAPALSAAHTCPREPQLRSHPCLATTSGTNRSGFSPEQFGAWGTLWGS